MTAADYNGVAGEDGPSTAHLRTAVAHSARMYDWFLGGKDHFAADRVAAEQVLAVFPSSRVAARAQRTFMHRAARHLANQGIEQFLDVGTGIPTEPNLHQIVQEINATSRVVYVDNDPIVLVHAAALMTGTQEGELTYLDADARDPDAMLAQLRERGGLDLGRPVALSVLGILHFLSDGEATQLVHTLLDAVPLGSALMLTQTTLDVDENGEVHAALDRYAAAGLAAWPRTRARIRELFLDQLDVEEPGVVITHRWRPGLNGAATDADVGQYAAVAWKR